MHRVKVTRPRYEQSEKYRDQIGEVVGHWGPENSADGKEGLMVQFPDGEVVGLVEEEVDEVVA
ncbi:MAG TPA: hypothetical protein VMN78_07170 [Longimicrobiales bacterium]|nr:hypothetical protein [Longimicrobiales bacterium]